MKKKSLELRLPYFFGQRIRSKDSSVTMPELIKPESEWQRVESGIEDILRWADDGGQMLDLVGSRRAARQGRMQLGNSKRIMHVSEKGSSTGPFWKQGLKIAPVLGSEEQFDTNGS